MDQITEFVSNYVRIWTVGWGHGGESKEWEQETGGIKDGRKHWMGLMEWPAVVAAKIPVVISFLPFQTGSSRHHPTEIAFARIPTWKGKFPTYQKWLTL